MPDHPREKKHEFARNDDLEQSPSKLTSVDTPEGMNIQLFETHKRMVQAALAVLGRSGSAVPYEEVYHVSNDGEGQTSGMAFTSSFWPLVQLHKEEIMATREFAICVRDLQSRIEISEKAADNAPELLLELIDRTLGSKRIVAVKVDDYLAKAGAAGRLAFDFDETSFRINYERFMRIVRSGNLWIAFAPLFGFESECSYVDMGAASIKSMLPEELEEIWYNCRKILPEFVSADELFACKYFIWTEQQTIADPRRQFDSVMRSLRLFKKGSAGYADIYVVPSFGSWGGQRRKIYADWAFGDPKLSLREDETTSLVELHDKLLNLGPNPQNLEIAMTRFDFSYERTRPEDRLIDLMIAFESIFSEGPADLSHKIPTRVARFLEDDPAKRRMTREVMKRAYNARNVLVHGNGRLPGTINIQSREASGAKSLSITSYDLSDFVSLMEENLRRCFWKLIEIGKFEKTTLLDTIDLSPI